MQLVRSALYNINNMQRELTGNVLLGKRAAGVGRVRIVLPADFVDRLHSAAVGSIAVHQLVDPLSQFRSHRGPLFDLYKA